MHTYEGACMNSEDQFLKQMVGMRILKLDTVYKDFPMRESEDEAEAY